MASMSSLQELPEPTDVSRLLTWSLFSGVIQSNPWRTRSDSSNAVRPCLNDPVGVATAEAEAVGVGDGRFWRAEHRDAARWPPWNSSTERSSLASLVGSDLAAAIILAITRLL